jgi:hypothetical protein
VRYGAVLLSLLLLTGCRAGDPLDHWRNAVEGYVKSSGGDLAALREAGAAHTPDELRPALATVSVHRVWANHAGSRGYRDAHGVLVGLSRSGTRPWYVFAVGICDSPPSDEPANAAPAIADVRVAAVCGGPERFDWVIAPSDSVQLARYLAAKTPPWPAMDVRWPFPRSADDFALRSGEAAADVIERRSGAQWSIVLPRE